MSWMSPSVAFSFSWLHCTSWNSMKTQFYSDFMKRKSSVTNNPYIYKCSCTAVAHDLKTATCQYQTKSKLSCNHITHVGLTRCLLNAWTIIRIFQQKLWCLCDLFVEMNFFTYVKLPIVRCENMSGITQCYLFQPLTNIFHLIQIL